METYRGIITFIHTKKKFGYILKNDGSYVWFHDLGLCNIEFQDLKEGMDVEFMETDTPKGIKAIRVVPV